MTLLHASQLRIDWRAQFYAFCAEHGGDPITHEGRLLFRDGWTHDASNYRGPQWPPPGDFEALRSLKRAYYAVHLPRVQSALTAARDELVRLESLQAQHPSGPLCRLVRARDEVNRRWRDESVEIDFDAMKERVTLLETELSKCEAELEDLT